MRDRFEGKKKREKNWKGFSRVSRQVGGGVGEAVGQAGEGDHGGGREEEAKGGKGFHAVRP